MNRQVLVNDKIQQRDVYNRTEPGAPPPITSSRSVQALWSRWTTTWVASVTGRRVVPFCLLVVFAAGSVSAQTSMPGRIGITVEGLNVWQQRNDVRIPPDTGTEFSLVDLIGSSPTPSVRVMGTANVTDRQQVRFVYAPLRLSGRGTPAMPIAFAGTTFAPAPTEAVYQFSSYRGTCSYACTKARRGRGVSGSRDSSATHGWL